MLLYIKALLSKIFERQYIVWMYQKENIAVLENM